MIGNSKYTKYVAAFVVLSLLSLSLSAQMGGTNSYSFLNLKRSAKTAALGMDFLPSITDDVGAALANPSTLSPINHNDVSITYTNFFAGINQAAIAFSQTKNRLGSFGVEVQYLNYGRFDMTEENGDVVGKFTAADYAISLSWCKMLDSNVFIGASLKPLFCQYESYFSAAIAVDLALSYQSSDRTWAASLMARNMGTQIVKFADKDESLPFELQLSASKKLAHAPFVIYVGINNLQKWNIREEDPLNPRDETDLNGEVTEENKFSGFADNLFRHIQIGAEFTPSKYFYLALGYSWKQNREMQIEDAFSLAGLSYGFGINYRQFRLAYSRNEYHRYGSPNFISLLVRLQ